MPPTTAFRKRDLQRAVKTLQELGVEIVEVKISPAGTIHLITERGEVSVSEWDEVIDDPTK